MRRYIGASALTVIMGLSGITSLAHAGPGRGHGGPFQGGPEKIVKKLDLTSEQKDQVKALFKNQRETMKNLRGQRKALREKMQAAFKSGAADDVLIANHKEMQVLHGQAATLQFENLLAVRKILTEEQKAKFNQIMEERQGKHKHGRGGGMDDGLDED